MHPAKFMKRALRPVQPQLSDADKAERLERLGVVIAGKRKDAVEARKTSGIELVWLACEEAYLGIDDMNRHEFMGARWAKPTSITGPVTANRALSDNSRSNAFVRLTSRYVDGAAAKLGEILLPIDDKAFSFEAMPEPDLVLGAQQLAPIISAVTGPAPAAAGNVAAQVMGDPAAAAGMPAAPGAPAAPADPAAQQLDAAKSSAERAEKRVYDWMVQSKYPAEARKVVNDAARIGVGVLKGPFPDTKQSKALTKAKGALAIEIKSKVVPAMKWADPWNIFPDDACGEDIHDGDYILERDFLSAKMLKKLKDQKGYLSEQIDKVIVEGPGKVYAEGGNPNDKNERKRYEIWYYYGTIKRADMALANAAGADDLPKDQDEVHAIVSLVNDTVIRAVLNPLDSGAFPYRVMSWSRRPGHWAGVGVGEQIAMPQRMVNASTRALLNNAGLSAGPQIIIDQVGVIPADGSWKLTPNKIWYKTGESAAADVREAFFAVLIPSVQKEMMGVIEYAMKLAEESSGIPLVTQGQTGPTSPETFGQAELQDNNAHTWLRSVGYRYDDQITEPLVNDLYEWLLLDDTVPDNEKGEFQINAHGSIAMVERAIQEQSYDVLLSASANPAFMLDPAKLMAEKLKAKRLDPRRVQYSPEEQEQRKNMQPPPAPTVQVAQINAAAKLHGIDMQGQQELQQVQAEAANEQRMLMSGGTTPHMATATARIEAERIRAQSNENVQAARSASEQAYASTQAQMSRDNANAKMQEMQMTRELAILQYANQQKMSLDQVKAELAKTAMVEQTKRELAAVDAQASNTENSTNRVHEAVQNQADRIHEAEQNALAQKAADKVGSPETAPV